MPKYLHIETVTNFVSRAYVDMVTHYQVWVAFFDMMYVYAILQLLFIKYIQLYGICNISISDFIL